MSKIPVVFIIFSSFYFFLIMCLCVYTVLLMCVEVLAEARCQIFWIWSNRCL